MKSLFVLLVRDMKHTLNSHINMLFSYSLHDKKYSARDFVEKYLFN